MVMGVLGFASVVLSRLLEESSASVSARRALFVGQGGPACDLELLLLQLAGSVDRWPFRLP